MKKIGLLAGLTLIAGVANAQVSFTGSVLTENFDGLSTTAASPTAALLTVQTVGGVNGWYSSRVLGSGTAAVYNTTNGGASSGGIYSAGTTGAGELALGSIASGSGAYRFGIAITNNSGVVHNTFKVNFSQEQWRSSTTVANVTAFSSVVKSAFDAADLNGSGYTVNTALDLVGAAAVNSNGAIDGNTNSMGVGSTLTGLNWNPGETLWLRWTDTNDAGNDALLAIDQFEAVPEPATMAVLALGAAAMLRRRKK